VYHVRRPRHEELLYSVKGVLMSPTPKFHLVEGESGKELGQLVGNFLKTKYEVQSEGKTLATLTFPAVADTRAESATPGTNFGTAASIATDGSPLVNTYLSFDVSGITGTIQSARLRLYATNGSVDGPAVYQTTSTWGETTLTWANRPALVGAASDDRARVTKNAWTEFAVTPLVSGNGRVSFVLTQPGSDGTDYNSREATAVDLRPQLVVTTAP